MFREGLIRLGGSERVRRAVTAVPVTRAVSRRFVAGETLQDFLRAAGEVSGQGLRVTGNYLGEDVQDPDQAQEAVSVYLDALDRLHETGLEPNVSVKPSQLGDPFDDRVADHLARIIRRARDQGGFVRIDMESSALIRRTLELYEKLRPEGEDHVGVVLQAYLKRTAADVDRMIERRAPVRLCKGAYAEDSQVAYRDPKEIQESYQRLAASLLSHGRYPAIATHDEGLLRYVVGYTKDRGIPPDRFEFQMLYGVRRDLQRALLDQGYRVRVYIPFGDNWYPYLMRRLAERPENMWFMVRSVVQESPLGSLWPGDRGLEGQDR